MLFGAMEADLDQEEGFVAWSASGRTVGIHHHREGGGQRVRGPSRQEEKEPWRGREELC